MNSPDMKAKFTFTCGIAAAITLSFSSCSNQSNYSDLSGYDTAESVASGEIPPWMAESSDPAYESGDYNLASNDYSYNPPERPTVKKSSSGKKSSAKSSSKSTKKSSAKSSSSKSRVYKVKRGDTLGAIARKYGTSVKAIKRANGLRSDLIHINQKLVIPRSKR